MEYIAQFVLTFFLAWAAVYSIKRWTMAAVTVFGILAVPLLVIVFFTGEGSGFWQTLGSGLGLLITGTLNGLSELTKAAPVMTAGTLIGAIYATIQA